MNTCSNCAFSEECRHACADNYSCPCWMAIPKSNLSMMLVVGIAFWLCGLGILFGIGKLFGVL